VQGDIRDEALLATAMAGIERVYHAAAMVPGFGSDTQMWETNVTGTRSVAQACLRAGVRRLVTVSSIAVYKAPLPDVVSESAPVGGVTMYGRSKAMAESVATDICRGQLELVIVRPCQIVGTRDRTGFSKKLLRLIKSPFLPVAGTRGRDFSLIHVSDVTDALCAAGERKGIDGAILNIASKTKTSLLALASIYARLAGKKARGIKLPIPESLLRAAMSLRWAAANLAHGRRDSLFGAYGPRSSHGSILLGGPLYDIQQAITRLDFSPRTTLEQGLLELIGEETMKPGSIGREAADSVAVTRP
jgi:nucleoside-diphosphate-sugar epimerase